MIAAASMSVAASDCSNGDNTSDGGNDATTDVSVDVIIDPQNCVAPTAKNNDQGIGGYCSPGGGQCDYAGPGGTPRICTADVPGNPPHDWFCTTPCDDPTVKCGLGAQCVASPAGKECVPDSCTSDAGVDSGSDASSDAVADVIADVSGG